MIAVRDAFAQRRWRWRLAAWALFVLLPIALPYDGTRSLEYLIGLVSLCVVLAVVDPRPLMSGGFGLVLAAVARVLSLDPRFNPYVDGAADPWVAVELHLLPLAVLPPLVLTWAIVTRGGKEPHAWIRLPGAGVAPDA